jgi:HK97 gp10 family phage protein
MMRVKIVQTPMKLGGADRAIDRRIEKAIKESAEEAADIASQLAPKDGTSPHTENLHTTIKAEKGTDGNWRVTVGASYGAFVEYGTVKMAAQPYLRPAINSVKKRLRLRLGQIQSGLANDLGTRTRTQKGFERGEE